MPQLAYFHIITHALFKALLFICAGRFINAHLHAQDLRWIGNLSNQIPVATSCISLANLALCGFPFIAGFYSKDLIIESALNMPNNSIMVYLALFRIGLTSFYSVRFRIVTIWRRNSGPSLIRTKEHIIIIKPIIILSFISIIAGRAISWIPPIRNSIFIMPLSIKISPLILITIGLLTAWYLASINKVASSFSIKFPLTHYASCIIWYLVPLSSQFTIKWPIWAAHNYLKSVDQGWLEIIRRQGINKYIISSRNLYIINFPKSPSSYLVIAGRSSISIILIMWLFSI